MRFGAPGFLPLLALPAALLLLWCWQLWRRRADARAVVRRRQVPVEERIPFFGELLFWLFLILAAGSAILALARPQAVTSLVRTAGVDLVILQDGSASMHVTDVKGDRWQRSMHFLRTLGEALRWENDRVAMALFAHMELDPTPTGIYVVDFNIAYHPYCYYSPEYDCPYPPKENRLNVPIRAGERMQKADSSIP